MTASKLRVRCLRESDVGLLRDLRLRALQDSPDHFGESSADALTRSDAEWALLAASVTPPSKQAALIADLDGAVVGIVYALLDSDDAGAGRLGGLWVDPRARGRGVGMALVNAVRDWATVHAKRHVLLWVPEDALPARSLYERAGFVQTGKCSSFPRSAHRRIVEMCLPLQLSSPPC